MIKYIILISTLACLTHSQRPSYAGSAGRYPVVLPQYTRTPAPTVGTSAVGTSTVGTSTVGTSTGGNPTVGDSTVGNPNLGNRIDSQNGETNTASIAEGVAFAAITTTAVPLDLPVEAYGDADLVNRIKTWPRDQQPFWYINQLQINAHRGSANVPGLATQSPQTISRSFFAG